MLRRTTIESWKPTRSAPSSAFRQRTSPPTNPRRPRRSRRLSVQHATRPPVGATRARKWTICFCWEPCARQTFRNLLCSLRPHGSQPRHPLSCALATAIRTRPPRERAVIRNEVGPDLGTTRALRPPIPSGALEQETERGVGPVLRAASCKGAGRCEVEAERWRRCQRRLSAAVADARCPTVTLCFLPAQRTMSPNRESASS
jgi:hypothetical protein